MKSLNLVCSLFMLASFSLELMAQQKKYKIVEGAGYIEISGTSNTSDWQLKSNELKGDAQMVIKNGALTNLARVIVNVNAETIENPDNRRMTRRAHKTLLVGENPTVTFFAYGFSSSNDGPKKIMGNIYLGGTNVDVSFEFQSWIQDDIVWISAEGNLKFSDFGLEPPNDFGGAVQTDDDFYITVQMPFELPENN